MKDNSIIKLENNEEYVILDKICYNSDVYYFCSELESNENNIKKKIKFFIEKKDNTDFYLANVTDQEVVSELIKIIKAIS